MNNDYTKKCWSWVICNDKEYLLNNFVLNTCNENRVNTFRKTVLNCTAFYQRDICQSHYHKKRDYAITSIVKLGRGMIIEDVLPLSESLRIYKLQQL
jgi:hypothetical protein